MKCNTIRYTAKGVVDLVEVEVPEPQDWEVQIRGVACGVCAWDLHVYKNGSDWPAPPGHEGIGRVTKVGKNVTHLKEGDWVTGIGFGFTQVYNANAYSIHKLPSDITDPSRWIVEPVSCAITGHDHCNAKAGDRIAVVGAGFMGQMIVQLLGKTPLSELVVIEPHVGRQALAYTFGADDSFTPEQADPHKIGQFDCVVDSSGSQAGLDLSSKLVRNGGRLNLFGWNHGTGSFPGDLWHMNGITVVNSAPNSATRDPWVPAIRVMQRGIVRLEPLVTHVVPLQRYPDLLAAVTNGEEPNYIKGVVTLD